MFYQEDPHIIRVDCGDTVLCDACNREPPEDELGGCLVGSWFYCCLCAATITHTEDITEMCPNAMPSATWIRLIRKKQNEHI